MSSVQYVLYGPPSSSVSRTQSRKVRENQMLASTMSRDVIA